MKNAPPRRRLYDNRRYAQRGLGALGWGKSNGLLRGLCYARLEGCSKTHCVLGERV